MDVRPTWYNRPLPWPRNQSNEEENDYERPRSPQNVYVLPQVNQVRLLLHSSNKLDQRTSSYHSRILASANTPVDGLMHGHALV